MSLSLVPLLSGSYSLNANGDLKVGLAKSSTDGTYSGGESVPGLVSASINFDASSVSNEGKGDMGWAKASPGTRSATVDITFNMIDGDAVHEFLMQHFCEDQSTWSTNGIAIEYTSTSPTSTSGTWLREGFVGTFIPTSMSSSEAYGGDNDATAVQVTLSFASHGPILVIDDTVTKS